MSLKTKKAFTLIEMLIVVVIIGILAAALIPRLQSVQGRARDTKRKADLNQIGSSLAIYKSDVGSFIWFSWFSTTLQLVWPLVTNGSYLTAMPSDQDTSIWDAGTGSYIWISNGYYAFASMTRNGTAFGAFALMARTESDGTSSNWVYSSSMATSGALYTGADIAWYEPQCTRVQYTQTGTSLTLWNVCSAAKPGNDERYIYTQ